MFADAIDKARQFTRPLFQSMRYYDGTTEAGLAACVFINADGWFVTAAHVLDVALAAQKHGPEILEFEAGMQRIKADPKLNSKQRHKQIRQLRENPKWITAQSVVVGVGPSLMPVVEWRAARDIDFAVGRIHPFNPSWISHYATFKDPASLRQGRSLCRVGYPFLPVTCSYDAATNSFGLNCDQLALFPNEGIYTREIIGDKSANGPYFVRFIETSSAGLRGQSGGPLIDKDGLVWGIQSRTNSYDLGFQPKLRLESGKEVEVYQFMNCGLAVHPLTIHEFLTHEKVPFTTEPTGG